MKIKFIGTVTTEDLRQMLFDAVKEIESHGVHHVRGCNLYFSPIDEFGEEIRPYKNRRYIKELKIKPPYASAADEYDT